MTGCNTNKRRFPNEEKANKALKRIAQQPRKNAPTRSYHCQLCEGWHLTKAALRTTGKESPIILIEEFKKYLDNG